MTCVTKVFKKRLENFGKRSIRESKRIGYRLIKKPNRTLTKVILKPINKKVYVWQRRLGKLQERLTDYVPKWRKGNFFSRVLRVIFEKPLAKQFLGIGLPIAMILTGPVSSMVTVSSVQAYTPPTVIMEPEKVLKTLPTFQRPVIGNISQGYHWYHPAVDIADNNGAEVYPVATGRVIEIGYQFFGYGHYVVIQHGEALTSLYAHLRLIKVKVDDEVKLDTVLGKVGSTGRSTGPHLHLEIMDSGVKLNPYTIIEGL